MKKKNDGLAALTQTPESDDLPPPPEETRPKPFVLYLTPAGHKALRRAAFEEEATMNDIVREGLNLAFEKRGLPPVEVMDGNG